MGLTDAFGLPVAVDATSDSHHGVTLVDDTHDRCFLENVPEKIIGDMTAISLVNILFKSVVLDL
jgi:hypothetical protein